MVRRSLTPLAVRGCPGLLESAPWYHSVVTFYGDDDEAILALKLVRLLNCFFLARVPARLLYPSSLLVVYEPLGVAHFDPPFEVGHGPTPLPPRASPPARWNAWSLYRNCLVILSRQCVQLQRSDRSGHSVVATLRLRWRAMCFRYCSIALCGPYVGQPLSRCSMAVRLPVVPRP